MFAVAAIAMISSRRGFDSLAGLLERGHQLRGTAGGADAAPILPSTAITRRRPGAQPGWPSAPHPHSQVSASNKASDRRSVDSVGSTWSAPIPKRDSSSRPASWIHSAIPSSVRAPANTAFVAALARMSS